MSNAKTKTASKKKADRFTGESLIEFMQIHGVSPSEMCRLFGVSVVTMSRIMSNPTAPIAEPSVCYLYRQYKSNPELIKKNEIDIYAFYVSVGGPDSLSGTDFSLALGRELSAYVRWFNGSKPSPSIIKVIRNALELNGNDPIAAFDSILELCRVEGLSRNVNVMMSRSWEPDPDKKRVRAPRIDKST